MPRKKATPDSGYVTLTEADKLSVAKDALRGAETDHYRYSLLNQDGPGVAEKVASLASNVEQLRAAVAEQEKAAAAEAEEAAKVAPKVSPLDLPAPDEG